LQILRRQLRRKCFHHDRRRWPEPSFQADSLHFSADEVSFLIDSELFMRLVI
jgi:hypothetical protein